MMEDFDAWEAEEILEDGDVVGDVPTEVFSPAFIEKCRELVKQRIHVAELKEQLSEASKDLVTQELDVVDMFLSANITGTVPVPLGDPYGTVKFRTRETHYAKIVDEDALLEYFEQRGMVDEVSAPHFVKKVLNTEVRRVLEGEGTKMPDGLTYSTKRGMTITHPK
jgi:hypothetical protein